MRRPDQFGLLLFSANPDHAAVAGPAGFDGVVVDWENDGKAERQAGAATQVNDNYVSELKAVRARSAVPVLCRLNAAGSNTEAEVNHALNSGADELLLPMVRSVSDVERALDALGGRAPLGIFIETQAAVELAPTLTRLPVSRVYVGLNDLAIDRGSGSIFEALLDGTVEAVRRAVHQPMGVAGLTVPGAGFPVPAHIVAGELARVGADFTFLRRSFLSDVTDKEFGPALRAIRAMIEQAVSRTPAAVQEDHATLRRIVKTLTPA